MVSPTASRDEDHPDGGAPEPAPPDGARPGADGDGPADEGSHGWSWHFVRVSGLFLAVMLVVQFTVTYLATDIGRTTARTMTDRWHDVTWRSFEVLTLLLALAHGALALGAAARDRSRALELGVYALAGGLGVALVAVAVTFR